MSIFANFLKNDWGEFAVICRENQQKLLKRWYTEDSRSLSVPLVVKQWMCRHCHSQYPACNQGIIFTPSVYMTQLEKMQRIHPREQIVECYTHLHFECSLTMSVSKSYLVLSGGLGSSPYVRKRLKARYENGGEGRIWPNALEMRILLVAEPYGTL